MMWRLAVAQGIALGLLPRSSYGAYITAIGDPMLQANAPAVLLTSWNFCNEAKAPAAYRTHPSPRWADCASVADNTTQLITAADNALGPGDAFPLPGFNDTTDANSYAVSKELFFSSLCSRPPAEAAASSAAGANWSYHTVMWKTGNMDVAAGVCPETMHGDAFVDSLLSSPTAGFNNLPMNQPIVQMTPASVRSVPYGGTGFVGWASGTYDIPANYSDSQIEAMQAALHDYTAAWVAFRFAEVDGVTPLPPRPSVPPLLSNRSYIATVWWKNVTSGSTVFTHMQKTSAASPWLMNYFKLMDASGLGSGYDWSEGGQVFGPVPAYSTKLRATYRELDAAKGGFGGLYLPCHGGCWKLDGSPCDGDLFTDITRYICFIGQSGDQGCKATSQGNCPPSHVLSGTHEKVFPNDTKRYPYECYSGHCPPGGCDPYSNPGPQELMMLLPCSEWAEHGYPSVEGEYDGVPMVLDVGALGARVFLSGVEPADIGAAARTAKGWAPLPDLASLPPYPGWTRSFNGFDFGEEQPMPGLVRYEFTEIDLLVRARLRNHSS